MLYVDESDLRAMGKPWAQTIDAVERAVVCLKEGDFAQPVKPYLRYREPSNRIIAMPAFLGGKFDIAGIKWIASFPGNNELALPRAHSVVVVNDARSGVPVAIINTALLSVIRTASVSGVMLKHFVQARGLADATVGVTGWGPIGQNHVDMCERLYGDRIAEYRVFDPRGVDLTAVDHSVRNKIREVASWQEAYCDSDVFMTCTVSERPYVDLAPKAGSLQLNVSLRDFTTSVYEHVKATIVVDDWSEVCRESTDIEMFHLDCGLQKENVKNLSDVIDGWVAGLDDDVPVMFNPMGMGVFDLAVASHYVGQARLTCVGRTL